LSADCEEVVSLLDGKKIKDLKAAELGAVDFALEGSGLSQRLIIKPYFNHPQSGRAESHPATRDARWSVGSLEGMDGPAPRRKAPLPGESKERMTFVGSSMGWQATTRSA
jgi:hypothetical protein